MLWMKPAPCRDRAHQIHSPHSTVTEVAPLRPGFGLAALLPRVAGWTAGPWDQGDQLCPRRPWVEPRPVAHGGCSVLKHSRRWTRGAIGGHRPGLGTALCRHPMRRAQEGTR